jgi:hypothetical protein
MVKMAIPVAEIAPQLQENEILHLSKHRYEKKYVH